MTPEPRSASFIFVSCLCGRSLRAKPDQVGTEIECWDCHKLVTVAIPRERQRVARDLSDGLLGVFRGPSFVRILISAAVLTAALSVPSVGLIAGGVALTVGAAVYGEVIRRVSRAGRGDTAPGWASVLIPRSPPRVVLCALMAAGTVVPLWGLNPGLRRSPHWTQVGALVAGLTWTALPIALSCLESSDRNGRLGIRRSLGLMARHPIATAAALAVVPASLAFAEAGLGFALYLAGELPFFTLDHMPIPGSPVMVDDVPHYFYVDFRSFPPTRFLAAYLDGLRHGYMLSTALPASLSLPTRNGLNPTIVAANASAYHAVRAGLTLWVATCLLAGFATQALWLGAIAAVEKKRPA